MGGDDEEEEEEVEESLLLRVGEVKEVGTQILQTSRGFRHLDGRAGRKESCCFRCKVTCCTEFTLGATVTHNCLLRFKVVL